jgi:hypothetical protein
MIAPRPKFWDCHDDLARLAAWLRDQRIARYPAAIAKQSITAEDAAADILAWRAIAADWDFVVSLRPRAGPDVHRRDKLSAIQIAIDRYATRAAADPESLVLAETLDCIRALHWHAANGRFLVCARFNADRLAGSGKPIAKAA